MKKERQLYNRFVDVLNTKLDGEPSPQELKIIREFLADNDITALREEHEGLGTLANKTNDLPFDDEDFDEIE